MGKFELIIRSIKRRGLTSTLCYLYHEFIFDIVNRTNTKSELANYELTASPEAHFLAPHQGASPWIVKQCFKKLSRYGLDISKASFLDIGSGKGRVMLLAAFIGFQRVTGIELDSELCRIAQRNFELNRNKLRCVSYAIFNEDAMQYALPETLDVVFMFNPFGTSVMERVLQNLIMKCKIFNNIAPCQPLYIVYVNPVYADVFEKMGLVPVDNIANEALIYKLGGEL
jgi:16S rRNA G966 N2-methylase RsmD